MLVAPAYPNTVHSSSSRLPCRRRTVGGHVGGVLAPSVVRPHGKTNADAHRAALRHAVGALEACAGRTTMGAIEELVSRGAARVADTTPAMTCVEEQKLADVLTRYERVYSFPVLTFGGNLNETPEKRLKFEEAAGDLTLRRRLVVVQQATGLPPPPAAETFS